MNGVAAECMPTACEWVDVRVKPLELPSWVTAGEPAEMDLESVSELRHQKNLKACNLRVAVAERQLANVVSKQYTAVAALAGDGWVGDAVVGLHLLAGGSSNTRHDCCGELVNERLTVLRLVMGKTTKLSIIVGASCDLLAGGYQFSNPRRCWSKETWESRGSDAQRTL